MTRFPAILGRTVQAMLPWPSRSERRASIKAARNEKEASRRAAGRAEAVREAIDRMAAENHFASIIAGEIMQRHRGDGN